MSREITSKRVVMMDGGAGGREGLGVALWW